MRYDQGTLGGEQPTLPGTDVDGTDSSADLIASQHLNMFPVNAVDRHPWHFPGASARLHGRMGKARHR